MKGEQKGLHHIGHYFGIRMGLLTNTGASSGQKMDFL